MFKKQLKTPIMLTLIMALLFVFVGTTAAAPAKHFFFARLTGAEAGTSSEARGVAIFRLNKDGTELRYRLIVTQLDNVTMAHIHLAPEVGGNGPPVV